MSKQNAAVVVAVPVKDEAERIGDCLRALASQQGDPAHHIVLFLNNCCDQTATIVRQIRPSLPTPLHIVEVELPPKLANAGHARARSMDYAADLAGSDGIVMTTDADGRVYPDWVSANLHYLRNGWDAVAGRAEIDPLEACQIPRELHEADAVECAYAAALDELSALLDPDAADPWPRHDEHSGASIAVTVAAYRSAGGVPPVALGEDRALFDALRRTDARIRHAPEVRVIVSGRIFGRARGGMADTIRRRLTQLDEFLDDRLEPVETFIRRVTLRRRCRAAWIRGAFENCTLIDLSESLRLPADVVEDFLELPYFGSAWAAIEKKSPQLARYQVPVASVLQEMAVAADALERLRRRSTPIVNPANRDDIPVADAAE